MADGGREEVLLLTGFGPFGPYRRNPAEEILARILGGSEVGGPVPGVEGLLLPVSHDRGPELLRKRMRRGGISAVVQMGLAPERGTVCLEEVALNLLDFPIPDEDGRRLRDQPIVPGGPLAYASTLPLRSLQKAILDEGIPCVLSRSAGTYLCNQIFYLALHEARNFTSPPPVGFVHLPPASESAAEAIAEGRAASASLPLAFSERAVRRAIALLLQHGAGLCHTSGCPAPAAGV